MNAPAAPAGWTNRKELPVVNASKRVPVGALLVLVMSTGCALMNAGASHMTTPVRRAFVSEEEAFRSLARYFDAAEKVVALYDDDACHANCLASYFEALVRVLPEYPKPDIADGRCRKTLTRFGRVAREAFGGAFSPCLGGEPWFGDVFEWVLDKDHEGNEAGRGLRMRRVDEETIRRLSRIRADHPRNPLVAIVIGAFSFERATCCEEVTTFHDWWAAMDTHIPAADLKTDSWKLFQLAYELLRRFPSHMDADYEAGALAARQSLVQESVACGALETLRMNRWTDYRASDSCALVISGASLAGGEIRKVCSGDSSRKAAPAEGGGE